MEMKNRCKYSIECNAPLCPLFKDEVNSSFFWQPTQDVCRKKDVPDWVKRQREIVRNIRPINSKTYFHISMLDDDLEINSKVKGLGAKDLNQPQLADGLNKNEGGLSGAVVNPD